MARKNAAPVPYDPDRDDSPDQEFPEFRELWPTFEDQRVTKVILTTAGEIAITDPDVAESLGYLDEVTLTIHGTITGKKHSYKAGATVGNATLTIESIELAGVRESSVSAAKAEAKAAKAEAPTPIRGDIYACGKMHAGHLSPCTAPAEACELARSEADVAAIVAGAGVEDDE